MSDESPVLDVEEIHTYYGDSHILRGVSLRVGAGQAVVLLGRNGMGKTTLIRSIIGFTPPRRGRLIFKGREITGLKPYRIAALGVGLVPQGRRIFPSLTVVENLLVARRPGRHDSCWTLDRVFDLFPRLRERSGHRGDKLSGGEQQMLAIARALLTNPELLLMDEPSEGLAPVIVAELGEAVRRLKAEGLSMLLVEQHLHLAVRYADAAYVLSKGQVVFEGAPSALMVAEDVKRRYLGL
ncbi:MAG: ABC transporter ATP-binding protein [Armatimonadota bacterium]|nr:ABC transporter ATP-binding protein [Armatimonadota bacterium]MDR7450901.1 ABC transporter ATP-binding protein [Armatimonadota bacterium]MDR7465823.1 ABC transporter ATP-binding protein [Armatimonadota bacterium]MDR7493731.1 ABC transporter ATP-binding protein [Armatimonadota bacterium]MDR7498337.1 ABC transporter ATP-binding protein [Armatimonadota bacterium]